MFSVFIFLEEGQGVGEGQSIHLDLLTNTLRLLLVGYFKEHCGIQDTKLKLPVLPFQYRQHKKYATVLHVIVSNALTLMVDILNI
jgi:hypothetical protein